MPWTETDVCQERMKFVCEYQKGGWPMTELCEVFGISRKTGYKYLKRFRERGAEGLQGVYYVAVSHCPERTPSSPRRITAGRSVVTESIPSRRSAGARAGSFTVHTWTSLEAARIVFMKAASTHS